MSNEQKLLSYQNLKQDKPHQKELQKASRFASIDSRKDTCDIPAPVWATLIEASYKQHWQDIHIQKSAMEMVLYPMLVHEIQPKTIIEIGAFNGGSAVWLADHLSIFGIEGSIYSLDIDLSFLDEKARSDQRINFLQGDSNQIDLVFPPKMLSKLAHPWLVIEDAHVNVIGVLEHFHNNGLQTEDYLIVEDTNLFCWEYWNENFDSDDNGDLKDDKGSGLKEFLSKHEKEYLVDTYYQDLFGYNGSKNWNSILKRV